MEVPTLPGPRRLYEVTQRNPFVRLKYTSRGEVNGVAVRGVSPKGIVKIKDMLDLAKNHKDWSGGLAVSGKKTIPISDVSKYMITTTDGLVFRVCQALEEAQTFSKDIKKVVIPNLIWPYEETAPVVPVVADASQLASFRLSERAGSISVPGVERFLWRQAVEKAGIIRRVDGGCLALVVSKEMPIANYTPFDGALGVGGKNNALFIADSMRKIYDLAKNDSNVSVLFCPPVKTAIPPIDIIVVPDEWKDGIKEVAGDSDDVEVVGVSSMFAITVARTSGRTVTFFPLNLFTRSDLSTAVELMESAAFQKTGTKFVLAGSELPAIEAGCTNVMSVLFNSTGLKTATLETDEDISVLETLTEDIQLNRKRILDLYLGEDISETPSQPFPYEFEREMGLGIKTAESKKSEAKPTPRGMCPETIEDSDEDDEDDEDM